MDAGLAVGRLFLVFIFLFSGVVPSVAQDASGVLRIVLCKTIPDEQARLKCYDAAINQFANSPADAAELANVNRGWSITERKAPLDDSPEVIGMLRAEDRNDAGIALQCREALTSVCVATGASFGSGPKLYRVVYRINDSKAIEQFWPPSISGQAVCSPNAISFIKALPNDARLFVRAYDLDDSSSDASFKLGRVSELSARIAAACNWPAK